LALLHPCAVSAPEFQFEKEHVHCRRSKQLIEDIQFKRSESQDDAQALLDVNQVTLPQEVCAAHKAAPPQFEAETHPTRNQAPTVPTTCWSAMSMTSRTSTAPEPNDKWAGQDVAALASAFPKDTQGSRVVPVVKRTDAVHSKAPPPSTDAGTDNSMRKAPILGRIYGLQEEQEQQRGGPPREPMSTSPVGSTNRWKARQEEEWEEQRGPPRQPRRMPVTVGDQQHMPPNGGVGATEWNGVPPRGSTGEQENMSSSPVLSPNDWKVRRHFEVTFEGIGRAGACGSCS